MPDSELWRKIGLLLPAALILIIAVGAKVNLLKLNSSRSVIIPGEPATVMLGDSHAQTAFDPGYIRSSVNVAQTGEDLVFSYYKLKKLVSDNGSISNVVLAFSYHSLKARDFNSAEMMKRYHLLLDRRFYSEMFREEGITFSGSIRYLADIYKIPLGVANDIVEYFSLSKKTKPEFPYMGDFESSGKTFKPDRHRLDIIIGKHFYDNNKLREFSGMRIDYLKKTKQLCAEKGIRLYLVNTPVHRDYYRRIPAAYLEKVDAMGYSLAGEGAVYLNESVFELPDSCFDDYHHLNKAGALRFSLYLNGLINATAGD